jgi:hypothetical protein
MIEKIAAISGTNISGTAMGKIKSRAIYHAKHPEQVFAEEAVHNPVPDFCRAAYEKYETLDKIRNS